MLKKIFLLTLMLTLTSCRSVGEKFTFTAVVLGINEVTTTDTFDVLVTTTNTSGEDFHYEGSSIVIGAIIYLKNSDGHIIRPLDVPVTKDYRQMVFKNDDTITRTWTFVLSEDDDCGSYDLYFEFFDDCEKLENFINIKE